jgi:preprotein translocase subunit SecA
MALELLKHTIDRIFGETNEQKLKRLWRIVESVKGHAEATAKLSDAELRAKTDEFRRRLAESERLDDLLPAAFSIVREVAQRKVGLRPYDVQVLGGIVLHQRRIAEMRTGEGKTLVATMPAYLNALAGKVHIITVNDYLAKRDREWMGPVYESLGLSVGLLQEDMGPAERQAAYRGDIIYGTNTQFGFDYLRDNLVISDDQRVQSRLDYAIIDEVDNILVDEARTPLIISGSTAESAKLYKQFAKLAPRFQPEHDYEIDEKTRQVHLTEEGAQHAEEWLKIENIYAQHVDLLHHLELALRAKALYHKDTDYIVKDGRVVIVDEFTGRLMEDRRYSDGLHQALEAKEGMEIRRESQTLAQITLQHYFRLYKSIAGMTGTAKTEEDEFKEIYQLDVVVTPTHKPMVREDLPDVLFRSEREKFEAVGDDIQAKHGQGRPVLIGTNSIEKSESLSKLLKRRGLTHSVLNAKNHEQEAEIIKDAGQRSAITVATNMAGRGVDIKLGQGIAELGGLHIVGCQRHESRRIDDQLRGRSGRQGDPGSSQFYISLEDDLIRLFGEQKMVQWMMTGFEEGQHLEHTMLSRAIRAAQKKVEAYNFDIRKRLLEYDAVMARQREAIYSLRNRFILPAGTGPLHGQPLNGTDKLDEAEHAQADLDEYLTDLLRGYTGGLVARYCPDPGKPYKSDLASLSKELSTFQNAPPDFDPVQLAYDELAERVETLVLENYRLQVQRLGRHFVIVARLMILNIIDENWRQHLFALDDLREGIGWRAYHGRDPLVEFRTESFRLFQMMLGRIEEQIVAYLVKPKLQAPQEVTSVAQPSLGSLSYQHAMTSALDGGDATARGEPSAASRGGTAVTPRVKQQPRRVDYKAGRNDPCPCGSGKKYKLCHGRPAQKG